MVYVEPEGYFNKVLKWDTFEGNFYNSMWKWCFHISRKIY